MTSCGKTCCIYIVLSTSKAAFLFSKWELDWIWDSNWSLRHTDWRSTILVSPSVSSKMPQFFRVCVFWRGRSDPSCRCSKQLPLFVWCFGEVCLGVLWDNLLWKQIGSTHLLHAELTFPQDLFPKAQTAKTHWVFSNCGRNGYWVLSMDKTSWKLLCLASAGPAGLTSWLGQVT